MSAPRTERRFVAAPRAVRCALCPAGAERLPCAPNRPLLTRGSPMTTSDEDRAREAFEEGNRLYEAGDFAGALAAYDRSLELRPDDPVTLSNRGVALERLGRYEEALAAHDRALELRPDHPGTHHN
ncbi:MAG: tetratricopeptide repeat protein, partial [Chloroflexi bacterium]|nr:tetratricopeptide repeat protein [Chloroflexota bacterium]